MPVEQRTTEVAGDQGRPLRVVLTLPDAAPRQSPGLVIVYEMFGLSADMLAVARRFAENGYASVIPDFLSRPEPRPLCVLRASLSFMRGEGREFADIEAARRHLASQPAVDPERIGVVGFCLGGGFAVALAAGGDYRVAAPFYGQVPKTVDALRGACPVVGSFGGRDASLRGAGPRLGGFLQALGVPHDVKVYPDAGHAFMTPKAGFFQEVIGPLLPMHIAYHEPSAEDAWWRTLAFFAKHLRADAET